MHIPVQDKVALRYVNLKIEERIYDIIGNNERVGRRSSIAQVGKMLFLSVFHCWLKQFFY